MASSLETRPPMLDHKFVEFCLSMKKTLMIKGWTGKWILKKALKDILPKEILARKKMGFGVPLKHYFKNDLKDLLEKYAGDLPALFIVSAVDLSPDAAAEFEVRVEKVPGKKCQRCWNYSPYVGTSAEYPVFCKRCEDVVRGLKQ